MNIDSLLKNLVGLSNADLDAILDKRDSEPFDEAWSSEFKMVGGNEVSPDQQEIFKKISNATNQHEITSYIVDDFDLIHRAKLRNIESPFISFLTQSYQRGRVPKSWHS